MKLNELLGVKKFAQMSQRQISDFAEDSGHFKKVGDGAFSDVYERNGIIYKFWLKDEAYEDFLDYVKKHQDCKFLPKLKSDLKTVPAAFLRHFSAPDKVKYVKMEKLGGYDKKDKNLQVQLFKDKKLPEVYFNDAIDLLYDAPLTLQSTKDAIVRRAESSENEQIKHENYYADEDGHDKREYVNLKDVEIDHPDGLELAELILGLSKAIGKHSFDLHSGNFASRGKTPVLIDPVVSSDDLQKARLWRQFDQILTHYPDKRASNPSIKGPARPKKDSHAN